jgi:hypothetical protein
MSTASAQADSTASLPITSFYQMVADPAQGYLFISQGSTSINSILVTNLAGQEVTTIAGQTGVMGIALSADGSTLYAALSGGHAVTAISTTKLEQTASYPIGDANTPEDVAVQSGKIWVSYGTGAVEHAAIGDIDLTAASPAFETQPAMGGWYYTPDLAADPLDSGVLIAADPGLSPSTVASYNVTVDPVTEQAQSPSLNCDNENDLAVVPGGSQFVLACGAPYTFYRYSTTDLSEQGSYAASPYPVAVAIDANGDVAAGDQGDQLSADLFVYAQGGDTPLASYNLAGTVGYLVPRGLAWSPDGSALFAVVQSGVGTGSYSLRVMDYPTLEASSLTLTGPSAADVTQSITLSGSLTIGGVAPPTGTAVTISRSVAGSTAVQTFDVTTAASGNFTLTDTPPATGQYTYTASYAGTSSIAPATASQAVNVTLIPSTLTLSGPATAGIGHSVNLTGSLQVGSGTATAGTPITITRSVAGSTAVQTFSFSTSAGGSFSLTDTPPATGRYTYTASYAGNSTTAASTASHVVTVSLVGSVLRLAGPSHADVTKNVTLSGSLTLSTGTPSAGTRITITRSVAGSTKVRTFTVGTRAHGTFSLRDTPPGLGRYTYTARYAGNATTAPATAARTVTVTLFQASLSLATGPTTVTYEPRIHVTAHLGATYRNRSVAIYAQRLGSSARKLLKAGRVNSRGDLTVSYVAPHSVRFSVVYSGDTRYAPRTVSRVVNVRAEVSESLHGYYGSRTVHGVTYRLYHSSSRLAALAVVTPNKRGQCVEFQVQEYFEGSWHANTATGCGTLGKASAIVGLFGLTHADLGYPYRIRADYIRSASDVSNLSNDSAWRYLLVES